LFDESGAQPRCNPPLPVQRTVDEYPFVTFVELRDDTTGAPMSLPRSALLSGEQLQALDDAARGKLHDETPLTTGWKLAGSAKLLDPFAPEVDVRVDDVLSSGEVTVDGRTAKVELGAPEIRALLSGDRAVVSVGRGGNRRLTLCPTAAPDGDGRRVIVIGDLAEFLADPHWPEGQRIRLSAEDARALRSSGVVALPASGRQPPVILCTNATQLLAEHALKSFRGLSALATTADPGKRTPDLVPFLPTSLEFVLYVPYFQRWELRGYTRGDLLNSIPLAPQEDVTIEVFSWDRLKRQREDQFTSEEERTLENSFSVKDSLEVMLELSGEQERTATRDIRVTVPVASSADISGGAGTNDRGSIAQAGRATQESIVEATARAATRVRTTRQTKVSESREFGSENRVTRRVRNANLVRPLTLDYFEVLSTFDVTTTLDRAAIRLCVLVEDLLPGDIDRHFVLHHEGTLERALTSDKYRPGFDAVRRLAALEHMCEVMCAGACACEAPLLEDPPANEDAADTVTIRTKTPPLSLTMTVPASSVKDGQFTMSDGTTVPVDVLNPPSAAAVAESAARTQLRAAANALRTSIAALVAGSPTSLLTALDTGASMNGQGQLTYTGGPGPVETLAFQRYLYRELALASACPEFWHAAARWASNCSAETPRLRELALVLHMARRQVVHVTSLPNSRLSAYAELLGRVVEASGAHAHQVRAFVGFDDAGFEAALAMTRSAVTTLQSAAAARSGSSSRPVIPLPAAASIPGAPGPTVPSWVDTVAQVAFPLVYYPTQWAMGAASALGDLFAGPTADAAAGTTPGPPAPGSQGAAGAVARGDVAAASELQLQLARDAAAAANEARAEANAKEISEAIVAEAQLLAHLNLNQAHYRQAVWEDLDRNDRYNLLRVRGDALLSFVENEVLGYVGRKGAMPFRLSSNPNVMQWFKENVIDNPQLRDSAAPGLKRITVPTKGLSLQTRLGACDAAEEFIVEHRRLDIEMRKAEVDAARHRSGQEKEEARRYRMRLEASPPELDDPSPRGDAPPIRVQVDPSP
jgi:hypothetical protein